jgi:hypothetical protein
MSFDSTAREILEALHGCLTEQNKVSFRGDFFPCEALRAQTSFGDSASRRDEFVDWLIALQGRGMVEVKRLGSACMVALAPRGRERLLVSEEEFHGLMRPITEPSKSVPSSTAAGTPKVFVSHSTQDHAFAEKFAADLRSNGVDAWYSGWEIKPGDSIRQKIDEGLEGCEFFIIVLSKSSISRPWVQTELDAATVAKLNGKARKIIPIKIEDCGDLPPTLGSLCWEDFSTASYDLALKRVLESIFEVDVRPLLGQPPNATSGVERPPKHPHEEHMERKVRDAISKLDDDEKRFIDWLLAAGRASNGQIQAAGFRLVPNSIIEKTGPLLIGFESYCPGNGLVEMDRFYSINPKTEKALKNVLYPP